MADVLLSEIAALLERASGSVDPSRRPVLDEARRRIDEPLRVAIAGKVKAGKSTLLNALVGEEVAPTDAGECTRIVTWYRNAHTYQVLLHPHSGEPEQRPFHREDGAIEVDLGGHEADAVDHLEVWWPSQRLADITLIDTPGVASISTEVSARTERFLADADEPPAADAVVYLLRHLHASDVRLLEGFHDEDLAHGTPVNAVAVLSRADEVGACRISAMDAAGKVAARYQTDDQLRRLCHVIIPVAGLVAQAGATLREDEHRILASIAAAPKDEVAELLLSADRFGQRPSTAATEAERQHVLGRLGLFGVRLAVELLRTGAVSSAPQLAAALVERSGVDDLRTVLISEFQERSRVLKARSALVILQGVLRDDGSAAAARLAAEAERIAAGAHEFAEIRLLNSLRAGELMIAEEQAADLSRLIGGSGSNPAARLGLPADADAGALLAAALEALARWTRVAEHPVSSLPLRDAARVATRTCEGLVVAFSPR